MGHKVLMYSMQHIGRSQLLDWGILSNCRPFSLGFAYKTWENIKKVQIWCEKGTFLIDRVQDFFTSPITMCEKYCTLSWHQREFIIDVGPPPAPPKQSPCLSESELAELPRKSGCTTTEIIEPAVLDEAAKLPADANQRPKGLQI